MEPSKVAAVPSNAKCMGCEYALYGNTTGRCPECGREFKAGDPTTYDLGNSRAANCAVKRMLLCRMLLVIFFALMLGSSQGGAAILMIVVSAIVLLLSILTLYFQTKAALLALGRKEALRYFFAALLLALIWLIGPILIPSLVAIEVRRRVRRELDEAFRMTS